MRDVLRRSVVLLGLLLAQPAAAVISCTTGTPAVVSATTNSATYAFASFTPTTNAVIVVLALVRTTVAAGSMVNTSGTALTWHQEKVGTFNSGADTIYIYWATTPASTAASVYTVSVSGDNGAGALAALYTCTGADIVTQNPIRQAVTNQGASTNATTGTITAMNTNNGYIACWMGGLTSSPASSGPTSWTEDNDTNWSTPSSNTACAHRNTGETATSATFTNSTTTWGLAFAEVYAAGQGPLRKRYWQSYDYDLLPRFRAQVEELREAIR